MRIAAPGRVSPLRNAAGASFAPAARSFRRQSSRKAPEGETGMVEEVVELVLLVLEVLVACWQLGQQLPGPLGVPPFLVHEFSFRILHLFSVLNSQVTNPFLPQVDCAAHLTTLPLHFLDTSVFDAFATQETYLPWFCAASHGPQAASMAACAAHRSA